MDEIAPGIRHWKATHPNLGVPVSAYWLPDLRVLLDPIAVPDEVEGVEHILLSCRHHVRDCLEAAERFGATVSAPKTGMHDYPDDTPIQPYDFGEPVAGGAVTPHQVGALSPDETALHIPSLNALAIADGAIRYGEELGFVPDQYMDDPESDKEGTQARPRRAGGAARVRRPATGPRRADPERRPRGAPAVQRALKRTVAAHRHGGDTHRAARVPRADSPSSSTSPRSASVTCSGSASGTCGTRYW